MAIDTPTPLPALLKVLSDPTRLRILALLELEELSVGELSRALEMAQSRVSNHLRVLRDAQLLVERRVGTSTYLRPRLDARNGAGASLSARLWSTLREGLDSLPEHAADRMRLQAVVESRHHDTRAFFDRVAGEWDKIGACFETGQARQRAVANLLGPGLVLADLGCGTGYFGRALIGLAERLICVDGSPGMLEEARRRLGTLPPGTDVELREGELGALPIADDEVDGAVIGMVLHHLPDLQQPLAEVFRVVRPGGTAVVLELAPHQEDWMRQSLGDHHLGLASEDVVHELKRAGFEDVRAEVVLDRYCPARPGEEQEGDAVALSLYTVRGRVPAANSVK